MRSLSIAATGMLAQQLNVEVISNNIANMNTTAFKRQRAEFQDLLYQNVSAECGAASADNGTVVPSGIQIGLGVKAGRGLPHHRAGQPDARPSNTLRPGAPGQGLSSRSSCRRARPPTPAPASSSSAPTARSSPPTAITVAARRSRSRKDAIDVTINATGEVLVKHGGPDRTPQRVGQLELADLRQRSGLGGASATTSSSRPRRPAQPITGTAGETGFGTDPQGFLETSNVNAVAEITALITAQRAYEMNSKVIPASDEMLGTLNQLR